MRDVCAMGARCVRDGCAMRAEWGYAGCPAVGCVGDRIKKVPERSSGLI